MPSGAGLVVGEVSGSLRGDDAASSVARRWQEIERRRRALAERLARELANPDPRAPQGAVSDFVAATAVKVRWARNWDAHTAFEDAPTTVLVGGELRRVTGRGGVVLSVHAVGDSFWSLVVPFEPFRGPVLICTDDFYDKAMWITGDSTEARDALTSLHTGLIWTLAARAEKIEKGLLPPD